MAMECRVEEKYVMALDSVKRYYPTRVFSQMVREKYFEPFTVGICIENPFGCPY